MFWSILLRESREGFRGFSFLSAMAMLTVLVPLSGYMQARYYERVVTDYQVRQNIHQAENDYRAIVLTRPVPPLLPLFSGIYDSLPDEVELRIDSMSTHLSSEDLEPLDWLLPRPYFSLITGMLLSLMAILFGYDAISGERERGTLKLMLSFPVARSVILFAKLIAVILLIAVNLAYALILYILMIVYFSSGTFVPDMTRIVEIAVFGLITMLTLTVFAALGIAASTGFKHSSSSLAVSIAVWAAVVLVWPSLAPYIARVLRPVPSRQVTQQRISIKEAELINMELSEHKRAADELNAQKAGVEIAWRRYLDMNRRWVERKKEEIGVIAAERDEQIRDRDTFARRLLLISPYGTLKEALGVLCATGLDDYYLFLASAERYNREEFIPNSLNFLATQKPWISARKMERLELRHFELPTPPLRKRLNVLTLHIALLLFETGILVVLGLWRFNRYDVR